MNSIVRIADFVIRTKLSLNNSYLLQCDDKNFEIQSCSPLKLIKIFITQRLKSTQKKNHKNNLNPI